MNLPFLFPIQFYCNTGICGGTIKKAREFLRGLPSGQVLSGVVGPGIWFILSSKQLTKLRQRVSFAETLGE
ncbi:hypothetical protein EFP43_03625 [Lacticaseibacillus paracasei]|nr:hypothetical protein [Lacticaseibacillus paracasei]